MTDVASTGSTDDSTATTAPTPPTPPTPPPGHGLLEGKIVVVTAAAGTGIGFATAKRCIEEGATVVVSDAHERRLGETAAQLAELAGGNRPLALRCDVTDEAQVQHLYDATVEAHGRFDVAVNNAGLGGQADIVEMTDEQWSKVLDITLTGTFRCTTRRPAPPLRVGRRGDRQQRLGPRLEGPGRPGPLRRGQGRGHGSHPGAARWRPPPTTSGSMPSRPAWPTTPS